MTSPEDDASEVTGLSNFVNTTNLMIPGAYRVSQNARRKVSREEFLSNHINEIHPIYTALKDYLREYPTIVLSELDFNAFCSVCYIFSPKIRLR